MSDVLRLSEAASLALHAAAYLAGNGKSPHANKHIAEALKVSPAHLCKVLRSLSRSGLLKSVRGPQGGFALKRSPEDISLLEVFESVEGPITDRECLLPERLCNGNRCIFGGILKGVPSGIREYFGQTTLADVSAIPRSGPAS